MEYSGIYKVIGPPGTGKTTFLASQVKKIINVVKEEHNQIEMGESANCVQREQNAISEKRDFQRLNACDEKRLITTHYRGATDKSDVDDTTDLVTPVLLCSLTRTAAAEIAGRGLPISRKMIGTLHSHAYRLLGSQTVAETKIAEWNQYAPEYRLSGAKRDTDEPAEEYTPETSADIISNRYQILRHTMVDPMLWPSSVKGFAVKWEQWKEDNNLIDFTDMISKALDGLPVAPGNPRVVIADESQDLSKLEVALLKRWGGSAGALIIAGDPQQSLYSFRGASADMVPDSEVEKDKIRVLGQSYRVSGAVHGMAMKWIRQLSNYKHIEYKPTNEEGRTDMVSSSWRDPSVAISMAERYAKEGKTSMFATTCSHMLHQITAHLRYSGIPFANPWRAKRGDWNPLAPRKGKSMRERILDFLRPDPGTYGKDARLWTGEEVVSWAELLGSEGCLNRGAKRLLDSLDDTYLQEEFPMSELAGLFEDGELDKLMNAVFAAESGKPDDMILWLKGRMMQSKLKPAEFSLKVVRQHGGKRLAEKPMIYTGTIHSFKGGEADHVFLFPDMSPAGMRAWERPGETRDSVLRTFYVGITRARTAVHLCHPANYGMAINLEPYLR